MKAVQSWQEEERRIVPMSTPTRELHETLVRHLKGAVSALEKHLQLGGTLDDAISAVQQAAEQARERHLTSRFHPV